MLTKNNLQEKLVALYLRLNGYTTTGLILQSPQDRSVDGEIDIIGVRFSGHKQPDRIIECDASLEIPKDTTADIIIGEVKGGKNPLQFNESVRNYPDRVKRLLQWIGICNDEDLGTMVTELMKHFQHSEDIKVSPFPIIKYKAYSIRPMMFGPDKTVQRDNQLRFINGKIMLDFCWACFRPETRRITCETDYQAISNWGEQFERLIGYFKNPDKTSVGTMADLYLHFKITN